MFFKIPKIIRIFFPSIIWKNENYQNKIWLTFDDGPCPEATPYILKILKEQEIKATFFLVGQQIEKYSNLYKKIIADGHVIANHSYSHKSSWKCNNSSYLYDIEQCQKLMPQNKLFRPPYGKIKPSQIKKLKKKYKIILWDVLSGDYSILNSAKKTKQNVLQNTESGSIIVFHNNQKSFITLKKVLKETIQELKKQGFLFSIKW